MPFLQRNTNNPFGLMPAEVGGEGQPATVHPYIVSSSAGAGMNGNFSIMPGDLLVLQSTTAVPAVTVAGSGGISISGTGTNTIVGVAAALVGLNPTGGSLGINDANVVLVYDDPDQIFVIQDNGASTAGLGSTQAFGLTYTIIATATGGNSQSTGNSARSGMLLAASAGSTSRINGLLLVGMHPLEFTPGQAASGIYPTASGVYRKWLVKLNNHVYQTGAGAV